MSSVVSLPARVTATSTGGRTPFGRTGAGLDPAGAAPACRRWRSISVCDQRVVGRGHNRKALNTSISSVVITRAGNRRVHRSNSIRSNRRELDTADAAPACRPWRSISVSDQRVVGRGHNRKALNTHRSRAWSLPARVIAASTAVALHSVEPARSSTRRTRHGRVDDGDRSRFAISALLVGDTTARR
jgi:hypothetical protein